MKKTFIFLFVGLFLFKNLIIAQDRATDVGTLAVLVQTNFNSGSGFYLADTVTNFVNLVTACHVLFTKNGQPYSDSVYLISYKKNSQSDSKDTLRVSLSSAYKSKYLKYDNIKDVAVFSIAFNVKNELHYLPFVSKISQTSTRLNVVSSEDAKMIGDLQTLDDILIAGYPKSLTLTNTFDFDRPLLRKGIIAGIDQKTKRIIADCAVYQGNSGGFVVTFSPYSGQIKLIGLVSEFVPFQDRFRSESYGYSNTNIYNSGYSVIIPYDFIQEEVSLLGR